MKLGGDAGTMGRVLGGAGVVRGGGGRSGNVVGGGGLGGCHGEPVLELHVVFFVGSFTDQGQDQDVKLLNCEVLESASNVATG